MAKKMRLFFSHDASASRDEKILEMKMDYGARGYGLYWEIVEYLFEQAGTAKFIPKMVSMAINEDVRAVKKFLKDCIEIYGLFDTDGEYFWSNRLRSELDRIEDLSTKRSKAASRKYEKNKDKPLHKEYLKENISNEDGCNCITNAEQLQNNWTAKEKKEQEMKGHNNKKVTEQMQQSKDVFGECRNVLLLESEHNELIDKIGEQRTENLIKRLSLYKASTGKEYDSDFATINLWALNDEKPIYPNKNTFQDEFDKNKFSPKPAVSIWDEEEARG